MSIKFKFIDLKIYFKSSLKNVKKNVTLESRVSTILHKRDCLKMILNQERFFFFLA